MRVARWLPYDASASPNATLCDLPTNGVAMWARGTRELRRDVASYVGAHFSRVMGTEMPVARQSHACVHQVSPNLNTNTNPDPNPSPNPNPNTNPNPNPNANPNRVSSAAMRQG